MFAARRLAAQSAVRMTQRRSAQTVPRMGTEESMKAEALEQLKARLAHQKKLAENSGHKSHAEEVEEMWKWIKISIIVAFPVCVLSVVKDVIVGDHHHHHDEPQPDYMKIRNKAYPWECEDCTLFDQACWNKCKAEKLTGGH